jgi:hypothetical protein
MLQMTNSPEISKTKLIIGSSILIIGFLSPLLIPLVTNSNLPIEWRTGISGFLAFGIPEIFMIVAVAIMGKSGFEYLKSKLFRFLKPLAPPDSVSLFRYRIGMVLFILPLLFGWIQPYLGHHISFLQNVPVYYYIIIDIVFITSFFVLGGDFWDKFKGLFNHKTKISSS